MDLNNITAEQQKGLEFLKVRFQSELDDIKQKIIQLNKPFPDDLTTHLQNSFLNKELLFAPSQQIGLKKDQRKEQLDRLKDDENERQYLGRIKLSLEKFADAGMRQDLENKLLGIVQNPKLTSNKRMSAFFVLMHSLGFGFKRTSDFIVWAFGQMWVFENRRIAKERKAKVKKQKDTIKQQEKNKNIESQDQMTTSKDLNEDNHMTTHNGLESGNHENSDSEQQKLLRQFKLQQQKLQQKDGQGQFQQKYEYTGDNNNLTSMENKQDDQFPKLQNVNNNNLYNINKDFNGTGGNQFGASDLNNNFNSSNFKSQQQTNQQSSIMPYNLQAEASPKQGPIIDPGNQSEIIQTQLSLYQVIQEKLKAKVSELEEQNEESTQQISQLMNICENSKQTFQSFLVSLFALLKESGVQQSLIERVQALARKSQYVTTNKRSFDHSSLDPDLQNIIGTKKLNTGLEQTPNTTAQNQLDQFNSQNQQFMNLNGGANASGQNNNMTTNQMSNQIEMQLLNLQKQNQQFGGGVSMLDPIQNLENNNNVSATNNYLQNFSNAKIETKVEHININNQNQNGASNNTANALGGYQQFGGDSDKMGGGFSSLLQNNESAANGFQGANANNLMGGTGGGLNSLGGLNNFGGQGLQGLSGQHNQGLGLNNNLGLLGNNANAGGLGGNNNNYELNNNLFQQQQQQLNENQLYNNQQYNQI